MLTACMGEADRREFLYKPAYCLAGGLAQLSSEECMPESLKEKTAAIATAKQKDTVAEKPLEDMRVYYTADQRVGMGYEIARALFAPSSKLTESSLAMSLEANGVIDSGASSTCDADKARKDTIRAARKAIGETAINRDTAQFLSEHYTDLQLGELYRVARAGGTIAQVKDEPFIMPDPNKAGKTINAKPKGGHDLGGIVSFTTSRVTSRYVKDNRAALDQLLQQNLAAYKEKACPAPKPEPVVEPAAEAEPAATAAETKTVTPTAEAIPAEAPTTEQPAAATKKDKEQAK
jgi:hypothetical protein